LESSDKSKLEAIEKALHFNPRDRKLMQLYLETIPHVHASDIVLDKLEDLVAKEPHSLFYWKHLLKIHTKSMTCDSENGQKLFEKATNVMQKSHDSDPQMIQLFKLSCLFLRQAGLSEHFFATINLMMSLNINGTENLERTLRSNENNNPRLLEYEELVLKSHLPMSEVWHRMEIIRSICNFLPVQNFTEQIADPQKIVFNEDVFNLVGPLKNAKVYSFDLFMVILRLLKLPLPYYEIKNEIFERDEHEIDCGMNFLSILLENTMSSNEYLKCFYNIIRELNISPNYLPFNVEYETYLECMFKLLEVCCTSFSEKQNKIVLIMWLRLQRLVILVDQFGNSNEQDIDVAKKKKKIKSKVKNILKTSKYQNDLDILTEYAFIESALGDEKSCDAIINMAINAAFSTNFQHDAQSELNYYQISTEYCERKLIKNMTDDCLIILSKLCGNHSNPVEYFSFKLNEVRSEIFIENEIEDYFLPKSIILYVIKAKVFYIHLTMSKEKALDEILIQINKNAEGLLKEKLYELYVKIFHIKVSDNVTSMKKYLQVLSSALCEYPKNIFILHTVAGHISLRWFDIKKLFLKTPTNESIFYFNVASKYREEMTIAEDSKIYQNRVYSTINRLMNSRIADISSILTWRLYLRAAFQCDFSKTKNILFKMLDEHPMVKQLYLDGARYLPEDHSQLHDLIIEKRLRIHAIAEEIEILRSHNVDKI
jgi:NRDE-2, necessary for RNA interference